VSRVRSGLEKILIGAVDFIEAIARLRLGAAARLSVELVQQASGLGKPPETSDPTAKLEAAAENVREALTALVEIKSVYLAEESRLNELLTSLREKQSELARLQASHEAAERLRQEDAHALRNVLGINELEGAVRSGKIAGFITGVLASLLASLIFLGGQWFYENKIYPQRPAAVPHKSSPFVKH